MDDKHSVRSVLNDPAEEIEHAMGRKKAAKTPLEQAKAWANSYLKRPHSEKELRDKLREKGVSEADIETVCALCVDYGFVNDMEYAGMIARHYAAMGYGPGRVREELRRRGIPEAMWEEALNELPESAENIDRLLRQKLRGADVSDRKARDKAAGFLYRRGYSWNDIRAALNRFGAEEDYCE